MPNDYINNLSNLISSALFYSFVGTVILLTILLIASLIILIIGCLLKSQIVRRKFLKASISILILLVFIILIPVMFSFFI